MINHFCFFIQFPTLNFCFDFKLLQLSFLLLQEVFFFLAFSTNSISQLVLSTWWGLMLRLIIRSWPVPCAATVSYLNLSSSSCLLNAKPLSTSACPWDSISKIWSTFLKLPKQCFELIYLNLSTRSVFIPKARNSFLCSFRKFHKMCGKSDFVLLASDNNNFFYLLILLVTFQTSIYLHVNILPWTLVRNISN